MTSEGYNTDYNPTGIEGAIDTNGLPWLPLPDLLGVSVRPLRASTESGFFSVILKLDAGAGLPSAIYLSGLDLTMLSGSIS